MTPISALTADLSRSLRRPGRKTLALIDKALSYLIPFEKTHTARSADTTYCEADTLTTPHTARSADTLYCEADTIKKDLLDLLNTHRLILSPYLDTDRVESNLRHTRTL